MEAVSRGEMEEAWPRDVNGELLFDVDIVTHGGRILVASSRLVRVHAEPASEVMLHVVGDSLPRLQSVTAGSSSNRGVYMSNRTILWF